MTEREGWDQPQETGPGPQDLNIGGRSVHRQES